MQVKKLQWWCRWNVLRKGHLECKQKAQKEKRRQNASISWKLLIKNTSSDASISTMISREGCTQSWIWKNKTFPVKNQIKTEKKRNKTKRNKQQKEIKCKKKLFCFRGKSIWGKIDSPNLLLFCFPFFLLLLLYSVESGK